MALQVWFQDDIGRVLDGVATAHSRTAKGLPCTTEAMAYQAGFRDALAAVAAGFGLADATFGDKQPTVMVLDMPMRTHSR